MAINKNKVQLQETVLDSNGHPLSNTNVNPLTSSDCVIMENGMTLEDVMGNDTVIDTPTIMNEDTSFKVGIGDSETKVIDSDVAKMVIEGKTYQNILPRPTTLIMNTDEKEFKINDKIDSSIVLDDNVAEIATIKGQTYVNVVQEESASEYVAIDEELNGQSITTTGKPEGCVKNATLEGLTLVNTIQEPSGADATVLELDADIDAQYATIDNTVQGGIKSAILKGNTLVNVVRECWTSGTSTIVDATMSNFTVTGGKNQTWASMSFRVPENAYKQNTDYIAMWDDIIGDDVPYKLVRAFGGVNTQLPNSKVGLPNQVTTYSGKKFITFNTGDCKVDINIRVFFTDTKITENNYTLTVKNMKVFEYQDGMENWDIPYFEGMKSVEVPSVKTTGKNLIGGTGYYIGLSGVDATSGTTIYTSDGTLKRYSYITKCKPNTTYILTTAGTANRCGLGEFDEYPKLGAFGTKWSKDNSAGTLKITTKSTTNYLVCYCYFNEKEQSQSVMDEIVRGLIVQLEESSTATPYEPYQSSTVTTDKNLFDGILTPADYLTDATGQPSGVSDNAHCYTPSFIPIQANEKFRLKAISNGSSTVGDGRVYFYDKDYNYLNVHVTSLKAYGNTFSMDVIHTVPNNSNIAYMRVRFYHGSGVQANSVQINKVIELRKVGDVQDELDLETGKLTQRIGEVVLDGSEEWTPYPGYVGEGNSSFVATVTSLNNKHNDNVNSVINDKFISGSWFDYANNQNLEIVWSNNPNQIGIRVKSEKASDVDGFKAFLSANNIKINYELEIPTIKTVDLTIQDQDNNSIKSIQTHPTLTHITTSSNGLIPFVTIPSQLKYPTIIKPSTTYTVQLKQTTINSEFPLTINLGGTVMAVPSTKFTITTPETLTSQDVIFTGKNNVIGEVVITEGDTTGIEYDYFEGMNDVKFSGSKFVGRGKNLYNIEAIATSKTNSKVQFIRNNNTFTVTSTSSVGACYIDCLDFPIYFKGGETYVLTSNFTTNNSDAYIRLFKALDNGATQTFFQSEQSITSDKIVKTFNPIEDIVVYPSFYVAQSTDGKLGGITTYTNFQIEEGSSATSYEPYKSVTIEQDIDSIPLTSDMFEQGNLNGDNVIKGMSYQQVPIIDGTNRICSKTLVKVKPNCTYALQSDNIKMWMMAFDKNGGYIKNMELSNTITTDANTYYLGLKLQFTDNSDITPSTLDSLNLTLQEVTDEIVLRSIGDVKDTLNLTTGEYVQRIGEVVLDGNESAWGWIDDNKKAYTTSVSNKIKLNSYKSCIIQCDKYPYDSWENAIGGMKQLMLGVHSNGNIEIICGSICATLSEWLTYLKSNPITVQYVLATPIIHKVNLTNTTKLPSYASTTHYGTIVPSNSLVPNIKIPSTIDYNVASTLR